MTTTMPATVVAIPAKADAKFAFATTMTTATATAATTRMKRKLLVDRNDLGLCAALFCPRFQNWRGELLAISLSNINHQNHLRIALGNMSRMDPPPVPTTAILFHSRQ